jgi:hypothetical protein
MKEQYTVKLYKDNKITLPLDYVNHLHFYPGEELVLKLCEDGIKIQSDTLALQMIRNTLRQQLGNVDLAQEIIDNRKSEVRNENT